MFGISKYRKGIIMKLQLDLRASIDLQIDHFLYHGYIYRISICFVFRGRQVPRRYQYETILAL